MGGSMVALADILSLLAELAKDPLIMMELIFEFCKVDPTFNLHLNLLFLENLYLLGHF